MSNDRDIYFIQVDSSDPAIAEQVADSFSGFIDNPSAKTMIVPETIDPLDRDEAVQYLEEMATALDKAVVDDDGS